MQHAPVPDMMSQDPAAIKEHAIATFHHYSVEFLEALAEKFQGTDIGATFHEKRLQYDMAITHNFNATEKQKKRENLISAFYTQMQPHFAAVNAGDLSTLADVEFVKNLNLPVVIALNDADTNEAVGDYLRNMIQAAVMWSVYKTIPTGLLKTIGNAAGNVKDAGKIDMRTLSQSIFNDINENDIQQFALNMVQDQQTLTDLCTLAASSLQHPQK